MTVAWDNMWEVLAHFLVHRRWITDIKSSLLNGLLRRRAGADSHWLPRDDYSIFRNLTGQLLKTPIIENYIIYKLKSC